MRKKGNPKETKTTPMMAQFHAIKKEHPHAILFFRMGDFYEMMFDDAVKASEVLGITLTKRGKGTAAEAPMCGVPFHAADGYIATLIQNGLRVAVCDQVEDPKPGQGLVKREVVRVVTPGTVLDEQSLDGKDFQYLASLLDEGGSVAVAFVEFSTGRFEVVECHGENRYQDAGDLLLSRSPAEIILSEDAELEWLDDGFLKDRCVTRVDGWNFGRDYAGQRLKDQFQVMSLQGLGLDDMPLATRAAGAALCYIDDTQKGRAVHIQNIKIINRESYMVLDGATQRNLELTRSIFDGNRRESLLGQIDFCQTSMGSRLLKEWLLQPLMDVPAIRERQRFVTSFVNATIARGEIRAILKEIPDMDRQLSRLAMRSITPRDLLGISHALTKVPGLIEHIDAVVPDRYEWSADGLTELWNIHQMIEQGLMEEPPTHTRAGGFIADGVDEELDELRRIRKNSRAVLAEIEAREREKTGIQKLKVQYNKVFGYYIEVGKIHSNKVPDHYVRKQTLVNSERYITDELKEYEEKILGAEEKILVIEQRLWTELLDRCTAKIPLLRSWSSTVAHLDVHTGLAELAVVRDYCLPNVTESDELEIIEGRHPVVEALSDEPFIPNDTFLDNRDNRLMVITGPNMGGKSTYLRQVALICLMAQIGSHVPAKKADLGVVDRIFTRVGASDHLARGQSTFMVEMTETANILHHASPRGLIILDEIGRGTSTFDGLSIAWSVAEHILDPDQVGAKTLFATHYHEMTEMEKLNEGVRNLHITVREWKNTIVFLRRIEKGAADQSYGIHVAQLAGLPPRVIARAQEILANLEKNELDTTGKPKLAKSKPPREEEAESKPDVGPAQLSLFEPDPSPLEEELRELDLDELSPRQALDILFKWRESLG